MISGVVTYQVSDPVKATLDVQGVTEYVRNQALGVMKTMASRYPYEGRDGEPSLKTETVHITEELTSALSRLTDAAGVRVHAFRITDCAFAREIAASMLVRQQAEALIDARRTVVEGAVSIAQGAVTSLAADGFRLDEKERARLVSNLLITVASDAKVTPVLSLDGPG